MNLDLKKYLGVIAGLTASLGVYLGSLEALANQPLPPKIEMETVLKGSTLYITVQNQEPFAANVDINSGGRTSITFAPERIHLAPGEKREIKLAVHESPRGLHVLHVESQIETDKGVKLAGPHHYQPVMERGNQLQKLSYEQAFLGKREQVIGKSMEASIDLGGARYVAPINPLAFKANLIPAGQKIEPLIQKDIRALTNMKQRQLPSQFEVAGGSHSLEMEGLFENREGNREEISAETLDRMNEEFSATPDLSLFSQTVKGHMSLKTGPTTYKAAWGWVVRAWQNVNGNWNFLGWSYVGGDGSWQIGLSNVNPGLPIRVEYQTKNRFVSLQDAHGNPYTWGDNWKLAGASTDIGYRFADLTVNGDLPGVDTLYVGATNVWEKFYNNGMNALRDQPIEVTFPNTLASGKCIQNSGSGPFAWSCSYWNDGKIYIIPEHAFASVVQHEIAHSINSYYWNGHLPPGSGGMHDLYSCFNNGLALTEGFADFISYWVEFDRTNSAPVAPYFNMSIETIPAGVCANQTAEMRVAATFWDMYDTHNDGPDKNDIDDLYYINQGAPVALYLNHPKNAMSEYLPIAQAGQSSFWQQQFTDLFRLNKIIP